MLWLCLRFTGLALEIFPPEDAPAVAVAQPQQEQGDALAGLAPRQHVDQVVVAMGHGAVAATDIHNRLRQAEGLTVAD